ncbi:MAG: hypothetical protein HUU35_08080 [Armatimonadetes bacterium]|nr:hypothetical protein [Armatimonadota bacterium]
MTPLERVEAALRWQPVDHVPFTVYERKLPTCATERQLRNDGLCIVDRRISYGGGHQGITTETYGYVEDGKGLTRRVYHTPAGDLTSVVQPMGYTTWTHEHLFKGPEDYEPLLYLIESTSYSAAYEAFRKVQQDWRQDAFVRDGAPNIPIQTLISGYMGTMTFSYEWIDRRDDVLRLINALHRSFIDACKLIAEGPGVAVNLGGNHTPDILGRANFEQYVVEVWEEACSILQAGGKLVGSHLDDDNAHWADLVAASSLDYVEAVTPAPDCDMTMAECRAAWPDKVLWINFPSSLHLKDAEFIAETTRELIAASGDGRGVLIGVTEDVPPNRWEESYTTILATCREAGPRPL